MHEIGWILQIGMGLLFVLHGLLILIKPGNARTQMEKLPFSTGFLNVIGVCEVLGGVALVAPMASGIAPWLTPLAAAGLVIIMLGAVWTHVQAREQPQVIGTSVITLLLAVIVVARWTLFAS